MPTDRELAQALAAKKQQNSGFDTIGAFNSYYNQNQTRSLAIPLDFGKAIPAQQRADVINSFNPTTRSVPNPTYYDPTIGQVVPSNPNHKGFWQGVSEVLTKGFNLASHVVAAGITGTQANLTTLGGDKLTLSERWKKTQDISAGQAAFSAAAQVGGVIPSLLAPDVMKEHFLAGSKGFDILDPVQRKEAFDAKEGQMFGRIGSWTADVIARFVIDPTIIGGKLIKGYRLGAYALAAGEDAKGLLAAKVAGEKLTSRQKRVVGSLETFISKTDGMSESDLHRIKAIRDSSNPAALTDLLSTANKIEDQALRHAAKINIIDTAMGNGDAYMNLAKQSKLLAAKIGSLSMEVDGAKFLGRGIDDAGNPVFDYMSTGPMLEKSLALIEEHQAQLDDVYKKMAGSNTLATNLVPYIDNISDMRRYMGNSQQFIDMRAGFGGAVVRFHTGFFYKRPKSWIDFSDNASIGIVDNLLSRVIGISDKRALKYNDAIAKQDSIIKTPNLDKEILKAAKAKKKKIQDDFAAAHFTVERKNELLARYSAALGPDERSYAYQEIEKELFNTVAKQFGHNEESVNKAFSVFATSRNKAYNLIKERSYSGGIDTTTGAKIGAKIMVIPSTEGITHVIPRMTPRIINESQIVKEMPTLDIDTMYRILRRSSRAESFGGHEIIQNTYKAALKGKLQVNNLADTLDQMIKFEVLARLGYPIRNVTEGSMRIMFTLGPMALLHGAIEGTKATIKNVGKKMGIDEAFTLAQRHGLETELFTLKATRDMLDNPELADKQIAEIEKLLEGKLNPHEEYGLGTLTLMGHTYADAKGATPEVAQYINEKFINNASAVYEEILTKSKDKMSNALQNTGDFVDIAGSDPAWAQSYLRVVNRQMRNSKITSRIIAGESFHNVVTFLKTDPVGQRLVKVIGKARGGSSAEEIAHINFQNVEHMFPQGKMDMLKAIVAKRAITADDLTKHWGTDASNYPTVNGAQISTANGTNSVTKAIANLGDKFYQYAGSLPENKLTKSPLFVDLYRDRMAASIERAIRTTTGDTIAPEYMKKMEQEARQWARSAMRKELYDLAERTDSAHALKYAFPFFGAFSDVAEKWGKIIIDDPSVLAKLTTIYTSPDRNGLTEERNGITYITVPSSWAKAMTLGYTDQVSIPKASLNLIFQGGAWWNPGAGWFVQAAASAYLIKYPKHETDGWVKEILPYGPQTRGYQDFLLQSPALRKAFSAFNTGDPQRANLTARILAEEMTKYQTGLRTTVPTKQEINDRTIRTLALQVASRLVLPFATNVKSPYQFYIDEYQRMRTEDPATASTKFYDTWGDVYFNMTESLSKNNTGINATVDGFEASKKLGDLIAQAPEYGWFLVGAANNGTFSPTVYSNQKSQNVAPGSNIKYRERQDPYEAFAITQTNKGWIEFKKGTAIIEAERIRAGFPSLNSAGAEYLQAKKKNFVDALGKENPDWAKSYSQIDSGKIVSFLRFAKSVSTDSRISGRSDIKTLNDYMTGREWMIGQLSTRPSKSLDNAANVDLRIRWDAFIGGLLNEDVTFGDVYNRILEKDDLSKGL